MAPQPATRSDPAIASHTPRPKGGDAPVGRPLPIVIGLLLATLVAAVVAPAFLAGASFHAPLLPSATALPSAQQAPRVAASGPGTIIDTITVQEAPQGIAFDSSNGQLFVANEVSNSVSAINGATNTVAATISLGSNPNNPANPLDVVADSANGDVYVDDNGMGGVSVLNGATDTNTTWVPEPQYWDVPLGMALDPSTQTLWVVTDDDSSDGGVTYTWDISSLSTSSDSWGANVATGSGYTNTPESVCYDNANGDLYVPQWNASGQEIPSDIAIVDGGTAALIGSIQTPDDNEACAFDSTSANIYDVSDYGGTAEIDVASGTITQTFHENASAIAYDSANGYLYLAGWASADTIVIDAATSTVVGSLATCPQSGQGVGASSAGVAVDSTNGDVYVTCNYSTGDGTVAVVSPSGPGSSNPTITSFTVSPPTIPLGGTSFLNVSATGGTPPYTYAFSGLPSGCQDQDESSLPCAPAASGTYSIVAEVTDSAGHTATSSAVTLTVNGPGGTGQLTGVAVDVVPTDSTVAPSGTATLTAALLCSTGGCPNGATYTWSLATPSLGSLSSTTTSSVVFTAGTSTGQSEVTVSVTLAGVTKTGSDLLTVGSSTAAGSSGGPSPWLLYGIVGAVVAGALAGGLFYTFKVLPKKRAARLPPAAPAPPPSSPPPPPPPPPPP